MVSSEDIEAIRARYKGYVESREDIETLFLALEEKQQEIDRAFEALGTTAAECANDSDVADLAGAIRASLTYERDISSQLREDLIEEGEQRPDVLLPFVFTNGAFSMRVEYVFKRVQVTAHETCAGISFMLDAEQTAKVREALRLAAKCIPTQVEEKIK